MKLIRGLLSLVPLGRFRRRCFYCRRTKLKMSRGSTANVTHFDCPRCGREYEQEAYTRLRQRWRTPLKEALFLASQSSGGLASLSYIQGVWRNSVIEEVKRELAHPSMKLAELFRYDSPRNESELREYLRMCVKPETVEPETVESESVELEAAELETETIQSFEQ